MKRTTIALLGCLGCLAGLRGQSEASQTLSSVNLNNARAFDNRYQGTRGTPFILPEWDPGILFPPGEDPIPVEALNFDRHTSTLCFRESQEGKTLVVNKYLIDSFAILQPADTLLFIRSRLPESRDLIYLERIYAGKTHLYLDRAKTFVEADYERVYSADRRYDEFRDKPVYYLRKNGENDLLRIRNNRKQLAGLFGESDQAIRKLMKKERLKPDVREDLVRVVSYYDSLPIRSR